MVVLEVPDLQSFSASAFEPRKVSESGTDSLVQPSTEHGLDCPSDRGEDAKDASGNVALREHGDGVDETRRSGCCETELSWSGGQGGTREVLQGIPINMLRRIMSGTFQCFGAEIVLTIMRTEDAIQQRRNTRLKG